ncbi:Hypothetical protein A7982_00046 [Minicystis rosea]|nr:Hypothetical protein A7982_00046 [Minicystis rosea]
MRRAGISRTARALRGTATSDSAASPLGRDHDAGDDRGPRAHRGELTHMLARRSTAAVSRRPRARSRRESPWMRIDMLRALGASWHHVQPSSARRFDMRRSVLRLALAGALVIPAANMGCGGDEQVCTPNTQAECACPGGGVGIQRCKNDGSGHGDCEGCSGTGGSGGSTSASSGSGGSTTTSSGSAGGGGGSTTTSSGSGGGGAPPVDTTKLDLLIEIDNSRAMADKQLLFAVELPHLLRRLVNPLCVDPSTETPSPQQPSAPTDPCPDPSAKREFAPLTDIHIGVITSSLGGHASDSCRPETTSCPGGATNDTVDDKGHLVSRQAPCQQTALPTYQGKGFLAWDPQGTLTPPGEAAVGEIAVTANPDGTVTTIAPGLVPSLKDLALGVGEIGCGYESQLESWYRFLVDPEPYQSLVLDASNLATPQGTDAVLLQQRKDFLRPSSVLAIILLSDENDCSIREYGTNHFALQQRDPANPNKAFYLPKPRSECATNPGDPCCISCGLDQTGCPPDPTCTGTLAPEDDSPSLRCWDQKRRFGIDFLYPIDRYITGLTQPMVPNRVGDMVPNPIFSDLDPNDGDMKIRAAADVFFTSIVGVPWQALAKDPTDLKKGYKSAAELVMPDANGKTTWDYVIGNPASYVAPSDPHMIESRSPRSGSSPFTGDSIAPPSTAPGPGPNAINGHEHTASDSLEYACIFPLSQPRDCASALVSCDCADPNNDNPLCEPTDLANPTTTRTLQVRAKASPGIRELAVVKALGPQGIPASVCPAQVSDSAQPDFAYRPAFLAVIDRLKTRLTTP